MTNYYPKIRLRSGDLVEFDGEQHEIIDRVDGPNNADTFKVWHDGQTYERHIDWFAQKADKASHITIE